MNATFRLVLVAASIAVSLPAFAAWEELRRNDSQRLAIDPASIKRKGDEVAFRYHFDAFYSFEKRTNARPHEGMIVCQQDPNHCFDHPQLKL